MWELDYKESWVLKNWCFWTVVLEKTLDNPLDCKEIQPVHPKGDQSWVFVGRTDVEAETPILWLPDAKSWLIGKDPDAGEDWRQGGERDDRGWDGWMASPTQWTWVWVNSGCWWWTGGLACCVSWSQKESDMAEWLNWTELPQNKSMALHVDTMCVCVCVCIAVVILLVVQWCLTLCNSMGCSPQSSSVHGILQAKNTGVRSLSLLQGFFLTQRVNLNLLHCWQIIYYLSHQGSPYCVFVCVCVCVWTWIYHLWDSMWFSVLPGLQWLTFLMLDKFWPLSLQIIFQALSLSSSSIPVICMLVLLMLSQRYQRLCSFLFILFPLLWSIAVVYTNLYSSSLICFSASFILLFFPASVFFISVIVLFISVL